MRLPGRLVLVLVLSYLAAQALRIKLLIPIPGQGRCFGLFESGLDQVLVFPSTIMEAASGLPLQWGGGLRRPPTVVKTMMADGKLIPEQGHFLNNPK